MEVNTEVVPNQNIPEPIADLNSPLVDPLWKQLPVNQSRKTPQLANLSVQLMIAWLQPINTYIENVNF